MQENKTRPSNIVETQSSYLKDQRGQGLSTCCNQLPKYMRRKKQKRKDEVRLPKSFFRFFSWPSGLWQMSACQKHKFSGGGWPKAPEAPEDRTRRWSLRNKEVDFNLPEVRNLNWYGRRAHVYTRFENREVEEEVALLLKIPECMLTVLNSIKPSLA